MEVCHRRRGPECLQFDRAQQRARLLVEHIEQLPRRVRVAPFGLSGRPLTNSSVFVTIALTPSWNISSSGGTSKPWSLGWLRGPLPIGVIQRCSPLFRSIAVTREYGGLKIGSPSIVSSSVPLLKFPASPARIYRMFPFGGGTSVMTEGSIRDGTYKVPGFRDRRSAPPSWRRPPAGDDCVGSNHCGPFEAVRSERLCCAGRRAP